MGTNFNFCVPCLVTSDDFLAKLPIAFVGEEREFEPEAAPSEDMLSIMTPKYRSLVALTFKFSTPTDYIILLFTISTTMIEPTHVRATYNEIHNLIKASAHKIGEDFKPNMLIAIGASHQISHFDFFFFGR